MNPLTQDPPQDQFAQISQRAFERYQQRGSKHGSDLQDWLDAEQETRTSHRQADSEAAKIPTLTTQEREIIRLVALGGKNKQIAKGLGTSERTLRQHLHAILSKLGLTDRFELIIYAYRQQLVIYKSKRA